MAAPSQPRKSGGLRAQWEKLSPKHRQWATMGGAFLVLAVILWPLLENPGANKPRKAPGSLSTLVTSADPHALGLTALSAEVKALQGQVQGLTRTMSRMDTREGEAPGSMEAMRERINTLIENQEKGIVGRAMPPAAAGAAPVAQADQPGATDAPVAHGTPVNPAASRIGQANAQPGPALPLAPPRIVTVSAKPTAAEGEAVTPAGAGGKAGQTSEPTAYIPSGSIINGVLINGIDAPTGRSASGQPQPVLVRIKHEALLPNRFRADVRECFALLAGYGDLSSERAILRAESFSCVRADGKVIDTKLDMYAVGEDGKAGIRGRLVSKQGSAIAKAMVAGFAQSYAQALRPNYTGFYGGANGNISTDQLQSGAYGGASSALDRVAKFYIDLANQMFPVVEVDAGRPVTLVVLRGSELALSQR